jgi:pimeloyl-ACP methyl ester carboxylesterase
VISVLRFTFTLLIVAGFSFSAQASQKLEKLPSASPTTAGSNAQFVDVPFESFAVEVTQETGEEGDGAENTVKVYAEISRGQPGKKTFVLLNGLIYDIRRWNALSQALINEGHTVIRYAYSPQPESLRLNDEKNLAFLTKGLTLKNLSDEVEAVLKALNIEERVQLVGLSFGSTVAAEYASQYPDRIDSLIFLSPLIVPLDHYDPRGRGLRLWLNSVRFWENIPCDFFGIANPFLCSSRDYWFDSFYNFFYENYLIGRVQNVPQDIDSALFKKSVFHLVRAARDFDLRSYAPGLTNVSMFVAENDDFPLRVDQERTWNEIKADERRSYILFKDVSHALPDEAPVKTAELLSAVSSKAPQWQNGKKIEVPTKQ